MSAKKDSLTECLQSGTTISPATDTMFCSTAVNEKAESTGFTKKFRTPLHAAAHPRIMVLSLGIWCSAWVYGAHLGYSASLIFFLHTSTLNGCSSKAGFTATFGQYFKKLCPTMLNHDKYVLNSLL